MFYTYAWTEKASESYVYGIQIVSCQVLHDHYTYNNKNAILDFAREQN